MKKRKKEMTLVERILHTPPRKVCLEPRKELKARPSSDDHARIKELAKKAGKKMGEYVILMALGHDRPVYHITLSEGVRIPLERISQLAADIKELRLSTEQLCKLPDFEDFHLMRDLEITVSLLAKAAEEIRATICASATYKAQQVVPRK